MKWLHALVVIAVLAPEVAARAADRDEPLIGLWAYRTEFSAALRGELVVTRKGAAWRAAIAGRSTDFSVQDSAVSFAFPTTGNGDGGIFRGRRVAAGAIEGFWTRPAIVDDPRYPEGASQGYAMPITLRPTGRDAWRATVTPLDDPFTLYLKVFRAADGRLIAAFRSPEQNSHGPAMQLTVRRDRDAVTFAARSDTSQPEIRLEATLLHDPERIRLHWDYIDRTIELAPRTPQQAASFFPRPEDDTVYVYRKPDDTGDGWTTARGADIGMDESALAAAVQSIIRVDPAGPRPRLVHSMAVAYRGTLVLDEYFYGHDRDTPHDLRSAAKTFGSVILGGVMLHGGTLTPETKLYPLVAPMGPFRNPDPRKDSITLAHVMTHSTGLACDDNDETGESPGTEDKMESQRTEPNWWKFTLDLPLAHDPGTHYAYCSGGISLTGAMLTMATGASVQELFERHVARPLQWGTYYWNVMPNNEGYLGGGTFVRTRDLLKLGQAFLDGGVWNGRRIVSEAWVKESTGPRMRISPETTGRSGKDFANVHLDGHDGHGWHRYELKVGDQVHPTYFANGNGGQLLVLVPDFQLVAAFTAGNYRQGLWLRLHNNVVGGQIIPAIRDGAARE